jgi:hypothetical protein
MTRYLDVRLGEREQTLDQWLPDLNLQDFFFWWYVKKCLHSAITKWKVYELKESISETIATVIADMLQYITNMVEHGRNFNAVWIFVLLLQLNKRMFMARTYNW